MIVVRTDWWPVHVFSVPVLPPLLKHQGPSLQSLQERLWLWFPGCEGRWRRRWREMCNPSQHKAWDQRHLFSSQVSLSALSALSDCCAVDCGSASEAFRPYSSADFRLSTFSRETLFITRNSLCSLNQHLFDLHFTIIKERRKYPGGDEIFR